MVAGRLTEARQLLDRMRAADLPANICCYNILLNGYARQRRTQDMEQVLSQLRAAGLEPTGPTYNTLLNGFIVAGEAAQVHSSHLFLLAGLCALVRPVLSWSSHGL